MIAGERDERDNIVVTEHISDWGADGFPEYHAIFEDTYDENNLLVKTVSRYDNQGDAALYRVDTEWLRYDSESDLAFAEYDYFSDGTIDKSVVYDSLV